MKLILFISLSFVFCFSQDIRVSWVNDNTMRLMLKDKTPIGINLKVANPMPDITIPCLFTGNIEGDLSSTVTVSGCKGEKTTLSISSKFLPNGHVNLQLENGITRTLEEKIDTNQDDQVPLPPTTEDDKNKFTRFRSRVKRSLIIYKPGVRDLPRFNGQLPKVLDVKTTLWYDNSILSHFGEDHQRTKEFLLTVVELTRPIWMRDSLVININLIVEGIQHINRTITPDSYDSLKSDKRLNKKHANSIFCYSSCKHCTTVGMANTGSMCNPKHTYGGFPININTLRGSATLLAFTFAHEMGHNLGMNEINYWQECWNGIMGGIATHNDWTACSNEDFEKWFRERGYDCMKASTGITKASSAISTQSATTTSTSTFTTPSSSSTTTSMISCIEEKIPSNLKKIGEKRKGVVFLSKCQDLCIKTPQCEYFRWKMAEDAGNNVCILYEAPENGEASFKTPRKRAERFVSGHKTCDYCMTCNSCHHYGHFGCRY